MDASGGPRTDGPVPSYPRSDRGEALPPPRRGDQRAVIALVLAAIPCLATTIAGIVLGVIVLSDSPRAPGRGAAVAAVIVGCGWILLGIALVLAGALDGDASSDSGPGTQGVTTLDVGDCVDDDLLDETHHDVAVVPCSEPHRYEVYANIDLDGSFPGREDIVGEVEDLCLARFETSLADSPRADELEIVFLHPESAYAFTMDPSATCLVGTGVLERGSVTGSGV